MAEARPVEQERRWTLKKWYEFVGMTESSQYTVSDYLYRKMLQTFEGRRPVLSWIFRMEEVVKEGDFGDEAIWTERNQRPKAGCLQAPSLHSPFWTGFLAILNDLYFLTNIFPPLAHPRRMSIGPYHTQPRRIIRLLILFKLTFSPCKLWVPPPWALWNHIMALGRLRVQRLYTVLDFLVRFKSFVCIGNGCKLYSSWYWY